MLDENMTRRREQFAENMEFTFPARSFCLFLFLIMGLTPFLNSLTTNIIKPLMIIICLVIPRKYPFRINKAIWAFYFYLLYMTFVLFTHRITKATVVYWASIVLFAVFFIVISQRKWSAKEICTIFATVFFASVVYSIVISFYNHDIFHTTEMLMVNGKKVNSNAVSYTLSPSVLCGLVLLFYYRNRFKPTFLLKILITFLVIWEVIILLALGQRGGFFGACFGAALIIWEYLGTKGEAKVFLRVIMIVFLSFTLYLGPIIAKDTHATRLFDYENLLDDNGRDDLHARAIEMIHEKPVFGGGYGSWERESGISLSVHNGVLAVMVIGGYTAGILVGLFLLLFIKDILRGRSLVPVAFLCPAMIHLFEDSGFDYYSYIPMILAYILVLNAEYRRRPVTDIFCV